MSSTRTRSTRQSSSQNRDERMLERITTQAPVYPNIYEACKYVDDDEYWYRIFLFASRGKMPTGFYIKNDTVYFKKNKKDVYKKKLSSDPYELYLELKAFLYKCSGIESDKDIRRQDEELSFATDSKKKKVVNEVDKHQLYEFIVNCAEAWELSKEDYKSYKSEVFTLTMLTKKKYVEYDDDGDIVNIDKIYYDEDSQSYKIEPSVLNTALKTFKSKGYEHKIKTHPMYNARSKKFESLGEFDKNLASIRYREKPEDYLYVP